MVDVHPGVAPAALDDPVDEPLEGGALAVAVASPDRGVDDLPRLAVAEAEQVFEPAPRLVEGVAFHVEPDVALVGARQQAEAALLLVREQLPQVAPLTPAAQLQ